MTFRMIKILLAVILCGFYSVALLAGGDGFIREEALSKGKLVPLKSLTLNSESVIFIVNSNGCTDLEDFKLTVKGGELSIYRLKKDRCRKMPEWKTFSLPLSSSASDVPLLLVNPISTWRK